MFEVGTRVVINAPGAKHVHGKTGTITHYNPSSLLYTITVQGNRQPAHHTEEELVPVEAPGEDPEPVPETVLAVRDLLNDAESDLLDTNNLLLRRKRRVTKLRNLLDKLEAETKKA